MLRPRVGLPKAKPKAGPPAAESSDSASESLSVTEHSPLHDSDFETECSECSEGSLKSQVSQKTDPAGGYTSGAAASSSDRPVAGSTAPKEEKEQSQPEPTAGTAAPVREIEV